MKQIIVTVSCERTRNGCTSKPASSSSLCKNPEVVSKSIALGIKLEERLLTAKMKTTLPIHIGLVRSNETEMAQTSAEPSQI